MGLETKPDVPDPTDKQPGTPADTGSPTIGDGVAEDMAKLGVTIDAATATKADLETAIGDLVIARLGSELKTDPDGRGYAGMTGDEALAELLDGHAEVVSKDYKITSVVGVVVTAQNADGSKADMTETIGKLASFAGGSLLIDEAFSDSITFNTKIVPLPVTVNDTFTVVLSNTLRLARIGEVLRGIPYAPNVVTVADVAGARK